MKIIDKTIVAKIQDAAIIRLEVEACDIARKAKPGQFVVVMAGIKGERIPLTIVDTDLQRGTITLIFQEAGLTTRLLGALGPGDTLFALVGPLGHPTNIEHYGRVIAVGGGVGIAEVYPVARALKAAGNGVTVILGSRTRDLVILEEGLRSVSDEMHITTDDGSYGRKGFVTDILKELLLQEQYQLVYAVGPLPMMRAVAEATKESKVKAIVSLNALMVDATGMCGCCRVTVAGQTRFSCVDGPEFDAHSIDWDELRMRCSLYTKQEQHICRLLPPKGAPPK